MDGAEPVTYIEFAETGQLLGERRALGVVLAGLRGLEAHVLEDRDVLVPEAERGLPRGLAGYVGREGNRPAEQFAQPRRHRPQRGAAGRPLGERGALGPPEVREDDHPRTAVRQLADHRQASPDPAVIGDLPGAGQVERYVQVRPQQHAPAEDLQVVDGSHYRSREATSTVRSTSRLE